MTSGKINPEPTVFFGSGPVAARSLELLLEHTPVEVVITKPRPPHHKGDVPVLALAEARGLRVITAANKAELNQRIAEESFQSRYAVLIDFGIIVSQAVIDTFELGIINSHFSLLPHLRGADPITWSIANGDETTGVSLMCVDEGLDTGTLITSRTLHLEPTDTTISLTEKLIDLSDALIQEYVPRYLAGDITPHNQPHPDRATYSRKLTKDDGRIDWNDSAVSIERKIRAFIEWPQSRARFAGLDVIITRAHVVPGAGTPSTYHLEGNEFIVYTGDQALSIDALKPAGKKEMPIQAFLAGYRSKL